MKNTLLSVMLIVALLAVIYGPFLPSASASMPWPNPNYFGYRKSHVLSQLAGANTSYPVQITVSNGSGTDSGNVVFLGSHQTAPNFGDVHFYKGDGVTPIPYWLQPDSANSSSVLIWVSDPDNLSSASSTIYIYYGNTTAATGLTSSNGTGTFSFYDPFNNLTTNTWVQDSGSWSASGGYLTTATSDSQFMHETNFKTANGRMVADINFSSTSTEYDAGLLARFQDTSNSYDALIETHTHWDGITRLGYGGNTNLASTTWSDNTNPNIFEFDFNYTSFALRLNGTQVLTATDSGSTASNYVAFRVGTAGPCSMHWCFVASYCGNDVSGGSWGSEESAPYEAGYSLTITPLTDTKYAGSLETWTAIVTGGTPNFTYAWFFSNGTQFGSGTTWTLPLAVSGTVSVYASVTDNLNITVYSPWSNITVTSQTTVPLPSSGGSTLYITCYSAPTLFNTTGYLLQTSNSGSNTWLNATPSGSNGQNVYYGFRIYIVHVNSGPTEVTGGQPSAIMTQSTDGLQTLTSTYSFSTVTLSVGFDGIRVDIYCQIGAAGWQNLGTWVSNDFVNPQIMNSTWTFTLYGYRTSVSGTQASFYFGSGTYPSGMSNVLFANYDPSQVAMYYMLNGNFVMAMMFPLAQCFSYPALPNWVDYNIVYGIAMLFVLIPVYAKFQLDGVAFIMVLLGIGAVGSAMWALVPAMGMVLALIVLGLGFAGIFIKVFLK
jgi:hypothetical protein